MSSLSLHRNEVIPTVFAPWTIYHNRMKEEWAKPYPAGLFYLKARIEICFGPVQRNPTKLQGEYLTSEYPRVNSNFKKCCNEKTNAYFDNLAGPAEYNIQSNPDEFELCPTCPAGSVARLHAYYCEKCPSGKRLATASDVKRERDAEIKAKEKMQDAEKRFPNPRLPMGCVPG